MNIFVGIASTMLALPFCARAGDILSPDEIVRRALRDNASIKAARAKWEMMKARVPQAALGRICAPALTRS